MPEKNPASANRPAAAGLSPPAGTTGVPEAPPLFYKKVVPLNREQHKGLYLDPDPGFRFARDTNCVYMAAVEFSLAAREYPLVFGQGPDGSFFPVALLGIRNSENLFITDKDQWRGKYIPAYVRRYPFILAADQQSGQFTVCIDEGYSGFNTAREGEPLLTEAGEGPLLQRSVEFCKDYQLQIARTIEFCAALRELNLLEPVQAKIEMKNGQTHSLSGFLCVSRDRLRRLDDAAMLSLVRRDYMEFIYLHLQSLLNMDALLPIPPSQASPPLPA